MKNIVVLGGSYGGASVTRILGEDLPVGYRVILVERNSHLNHIYNFPRYGVLGGHEHKAFIPYKNVFHRPVPQDHDARPPTTSTSNPTLACTRNIFLHAHVTKITASSIIIDRKFPEHGLGTVIPFEYAVYALGSRLPAPIDVWRGTPIARDNGYKGTKSEGIQWLQRCQDQIAHAKSILVVGGGALGIQFATDIASIHPTKHVTLLHSRQQLLPRFDPEMHTKILQAMQDLRIDVILGERLDHSSLKENVQNVDGQDIGPRTIRTTTGREIPADLILLCTGQTPNTAILSSAFPGSVNPSTRLANVSRTMQLRVRLEPEDPQTQTQIQVPSRYPGSHIFVVGDCADVPGAINAGHEAHAQAELAARNILRLIEWECRRNAREATDGGIQVARNVPNPKLEPEEELKLEEYTPYPPGIKVSLGLGKAVYQMRGDIETKVGEPDDLNAAYMWRSFGIGEVKEEDMYE